VGGSQGAGLRRAGADGLSAVSEPVLRCEALSCRYGRDEPVLRDATFELRRGELWALLGPNGAGKSTLLRALAGLCAPSAGTVVLDGALLATLSPRERARRLAWVAQEELAPERRTVREYVSLGRAPYTPWHGALTDEDRAAVRDALVWASIEAIAERDVAELSGGERRRVSLARAYAQKTEVLLFDEPTAFLDPKQQWWVAEAIAKLVREDGRAAVMVVHDPALALRYATHAALLLDGRIVTKGAVRSVIVRDELARVFGVEARVGADPESGVPYVVTVRG
jgi:iron complex transport system ATP-binding protein